jgi:hypothetical protein
MPLFQNYLINSNYMVQLDKDLFVSVLSLHDIEPVVKIHPYNLGLYCSSNSLYFVSNKLDQQLKNNYVPINEMYENMILHCDEGQNYFTVRNICQKSIRSNLVEPIYVLETKIVISEPINLGAVIGKNVYFNTPNDKKNVGMIINVEHVSNTEFESEISSDMLVFTIIPYQIVYLLLKMFIYNNNFMKLTSEFELDYSKNKLYYVPTLSKKKFEVVSIEDNFIDQELKIYSPALNIMTSINLFVMLCDKSSINISVRDLKTNMINKYYSKLAVVDDSKFLVRINKGIVKEFNGLLLTELSEQLIEEMVEEYDISAIDYNYKSPETNDKIIVLLNPTILNREDDNISNQLLILKKINKKTITSLHDLDLIDKGLRNNFQFIRPDNQEFKIQI